MARDVATLRKAERARFDAKGQERARSRDRGGLDSEMAALLDAYRGDARALGGSLEDLLDARGVPASERADVYQQVERQLGQAAARRAFTGLRSGRSPTPTAEGIRDGDGERAETTASLINRLSAGMGLQRDAVTVDVTARAGAETGARGARGVAVGNTVYLDPGRYDPTTQEGKALLAHEVAHVAQRQNGPANLTSGGAMPGRVGMGPEAEARSLATQFAVEGSVTAPKAQLSAHAIAADTGRDAGQEQEGEEEQVQEIDPPRELAVPQTATEDEIQDVNESQGLPRDAHQDGPGRQPAADTDAADANPREGRKGAKGGGKGGPGRKGARGGKGGPQEGEQETDEAQQEEQQVQGTGPDAAPQEGPPGPGGPQAIAPPVLRPLQFGVAKREDLGEVGVKEIIEERPDGTVVFVPQDPLQLDQKGGKAKSLAPTESELLKANRRAEAAAALSAFASAGEAKAAGLDQFKTSVGAQLSSATEAGLARITASLEQNRLALTAAFTAAGRTVQRNAAVAIARVRASALTAKAAVTTETTTRRTAIETAATTAITEVAGFETALRTQVATAFTASAATIRASGTTKAAEARSRGESAGNAYTSPPASNGGFFEGKEYNRNKQRARAGAARDVAAAYAAEFTRKATETATALLAAQPDVTSGCAQRVTAANDQINAAKTAALGQVDQSATASNTAIDRALEQAVTGITSQSTQQQAGLRTSEAEQQRSLQGSARTARSQLSEQGRTLSESIGTQLTEAALQIRTQVSNVTGLGAGADFPDVVALQSALSTTLASLEGMVTEIQGTINAAVGTQGGNVATQVQGIEESFTQLVAQGTEQANGVATGFTQSSTQLATATTNGMVATSTAHRTQCEQAATTATTNINTAKTGVQTDFTNIETNLASTLAKTETDFTAGLNASLGDMAGTIRSKADEAAAKVQPAWKSVLKVIISIVAAIIVAIVIAVLVASGVGLLVGCLIAAAVGAAVGVAKYLATQALMGEEITFMGALAEGVSGAFGAVVGFLTAGAGAGLMSQMSGRLTGALTQFVGRTAAKFIGPALFEGFVSGITETVGEVIKRAIDPDKDITWQSVLSAFGGGFIGGSLGSFGPRLPIRRPTIHGTEGLTRSLMPVAGRLAGNTNPLSNRVLGLGVQRVGEDVVKAGTGELSKGTAGELGVNADASDNRSSLQSSAATAARASVNRNVQLPNFSNLGQTPAPAPGGPAPGPTPQTQGPGTQTPQQAP